MHYPIQGDNSSNYLSAPAGSYHNWAIYGYGGHDILEGANGNDALFGGSGNDDLYGENGNDTLSGGTGYNYLDGGNGYDTADYSFYNTTTSIYGLNINLSTFEAWNRGSGPIVDDILSSIEGVVGSVKADYIVGNSIRNILEGNSGSDIIVGGGGNDTIIGGGGNDDIWGDRGADYLIGGNDFDYFNYDSINDSNSFYGRDTIGDFVHTVDTIDVSVIDARTGYSGNQAFTWKGNDSTFNGAQGELHYWRFQNSSGAWKTVVEGDINGDKVADLQIYLNGYKSLDTYDFIL